MSVSSFMSYPSDNRQCFVVRCSTISFMWIADFFLCRDSISFFYICKPDETERFTGLYEKINLSWKCRKCIVLISRHDLRLVEHKGFVPIIFKDPWRTTVLCTLMLLFSSRTSLPEMIIKKNDCEHILHLFSLRSSICCFCPIKNHLDCITFVCEGQIKNPGGTPKVLYGEAPPQVLTPYSFIYYF